jgi:hypothetical protein
MHYCQSCVPPKKVLKLLTTLSTNDLCMYSATAAYLILFTQNMVENCRKLEAFESFGFFDFFCRFVLQNGQNLQHNFTSCVPPKKTLELHTTLSTNDLGIYLGSATYLILFTQNIVENGQKLEDFKVFGFLTFFADFWFKTARNWKIKLF